MASYLTAKAQATKENKLGFIKMEFLCLEENKKIAHGMEQNTCKLSDKGLTPDHIKSLQFNSKKTNNSI